MNIFKGWTAPLAHVILVELLSYFHSCISLFNLTPNQNEWLERSISSTRIALTLCLVSVSTTDLLSPNIMKSETLHKINILDKIEKFYSTYFSGGTTCQIFSIMVSHLCFKNEANLSLLRICGTVLGLRNTLPLCGIWHQLFCISLASIYFESTLTIIILIFHRDRRGEGTKSNMLHSVINSLVEVERYKTKNQLKVRHNLILVTVCLTHSLKLAWSYDGPLKDNS